LPEFLIHVGGTVVARWPGVLFGLLVPVFALLISEPLKAFWSSLSVGPLLTLPVSEHLGAGAAFLATLLLFDFLQYWEHRFEHRFFWSVHAVHHSVEELSAATSYSHPLQFVPMFLLISVPLSLVDFGPTSPNGMVLFAIGLLPVLIHSPVRLRFGPLRHLLVDPHYHRIHHSLEERHFDRNFSIIFSFWDRLFGTCVMPRGDEWPATGIHEAYSPRTVAELLLFPLRLARPTPAPDATCLPPEPGEANRQAA